MATDPTNIGSLTTTFTPTATSCSTWFIAQRNRDTWLQYGTVGTDAPACFPSGYEPISGYYSPGVCPQGYQHACTGGISETVTIATCCPSGFSCQSSRGTDDANACYTKFASDSSMSVAVWTTLDGGAFSLATSTNTLHNQNKRAYAHGIVVRREGDDPTWPDPAKSSVSPTPTTSQPNADDGMGSSTGLSSGAKIGVGLGVPLGLLLIGGSAAAVFLVRKRRTRHRQNEEYDHNVRPDEPSKALPVEAGSTTHYVEVPGADDDIMGRHPRELSASREPAELDAMVRT
ncbi:hypothetical protein PG985_009640 [Apiospora marii]|uniref:Uncharacterized protein n=1 Tax=Apiospora marii TaxID=335849 RepID=A0ABR1RG88_9PEZI